MHDTHSERMSSGETRAAGGLATVFAFRMLGMFMVLPVLATYGMDRRREPCTDRSGDWRLRPDPGGVADTVRDHFRPYRPATGHLFRPDHLCDRQRGGGERGFDLGNHCRTYPAGAGAISAAVMALLSDLTREQHRTKAMAMIGMTIGLSFAIAMVVGPVITGMFGLSDCSRPPAAWP